MYLMDTIAGAAALVVENPLWGSLARGRLPPVLRVYGDLLDKLDGVPRFLLDGKATHTAVEINLGRPKVVLEAMQHIRVPYERLWFEWDDADRQALRDRFPDYVGSHPELRPMPGRIGCLIEAAPDGRSGTLSWAWTTPRQPGEDGTAGQFPNIGAVATHFDFDQIFPLDEERRIGIEKGNLAPFWRDNPVQLEALFDIWRHARFAVSDWGESYLRELPDPRLARALSYADVVGEWIMAIAVLLLLTASRPVVNLTPVSQAKLNKHRCRRGEVPLLDYTRVTLHLRGAAERSRPGQPLGYQRKSPRVHMVSSYLARRGTKHWIVSPYFRGSGDTVSRHVSVRG